MIRPRRADSNRAISQEISRTAKIRYNHACLNSIQEKEMQRDQQDDTTAHILREAAPGNKFLIGITETVPVDRWQESFMAISRAIQKHGRLSIVEVV